MQNEPAGGAPLERGVGRLPDEGTKGRRAMRNKVGQLAVVVPWAEAAADIQAHGGKVVTPAKYARCGLGPPAWHTDPTLFDGYGNSLAWDDRDLKPLGKPPAVARKKDACAA